MQSAITGIGIISPIGNNCSDILKSLRCLKDGIGKVTKICTQGMQSDMGGQVKDFNAAAFMTNGELAEFTDPFIRLAICSAKSALQDANISQLDNDCAVVMASCNAGMTSGEREYLQMFGKNEKPFTKNDLEQYEYCALPRAMAKSLNTRCPMWMINTACSGATAALAFAQLLVKSGKFKRVLAGGADAFALANYAGFSAIKVMSKEKTAPFSDPVGMNIGEGAAFWLVENLGEAEKRNSKIYGKIIGHATTGDAHHPTQPDPRGEGAYKTMLKAVKDACIEISQIGCINAHASGTSANDKAESKGIAKFCKDEIYVTSTKSYTGHCMGATGIIEATCQLLSMNDNFIPPTLRFTNLRSECDKIKVAAGNGVELNYNCFLSANYAFAGNNAAIVVAKKDFAPKAESAYNAAAKIVITGYSSMSCLGLNCAEQLENYETDKNCIGSLNGNFAGKIRTLTRGDFDRRVDFSGMNLISQFATISAKKAFDNAQIKISRQNENDIGIAEAVSRGAPDTDHMVGVFRDEIPHGDISCFSNVTANSTAGWATKGLGVKGSNITLTSGFDSGILAMDYAAYMLRANSAKQMLAQSTDEVFLSQLNAYKNAGMIYDNLNDFNFCGKDEFKSVYGEGSCAFVLENKNLAIERNAKIYAELLAFESSMNIGAFYSQNLESEGLENTLKKALKSANLAAKDIDFAVFAPMGNVCDIKLKEVCEKYFGNATKVFTSLKTGYLQSGSSLNALSLLLCALEKKSSAFNANKFNKNCANIAVFASPRTFNNYAMILKAFL